MKHLYLILFVLAVAGCQNLADQEAQRKLQREKAFEQFKPLFQEMVTDTSSRLSCSDLAFGPEVEGANLLSDSLILAAIDTGLLRRAHFNPANGYSYYAIGSFPYTDILVAYLVGAYGGEGQRVSHLFLYDLEAQDFTSTHSLSYNLSGGDFSTRRDAWLYDLNQDQIRDLVYNLNFSYQTDSSDNSLVITDSLHAEIWDGNGFADYRLSDPNSLRMDLALLPIEESTEETKGQALDEFF